MRRFESSFHIVCTGTVCACSRRFHCSFRFDKLQFWNVRYFPSHVDSETWNRRLQLFYNSMEKIARGKRYRRDMQNATIGIVPNVLLIATGYRGSFVRIIKMEDRWWFLEVQFATIDKDTLAKIQKLIILVAVPIQCLIDVNVFLKYRKH